MIVTSMQLTISSRRDIAVLQKESSALGGEENVNIGHRALQKAGQDIVLTRRCGWGLGSVVNYCFFWRFFLFSRNPAAAPIHAARAFGARRHPRVEHPFGGDVEYEACAGELAQRRCAKSTQLRRRRLRS